MKVAIITGISGQDGAYLSQLLLKNDYKVIGLTRNNHSLDLYGLKYLNLDKSITIEECDLQDITGVINLVKKYQPDEIYNLAAQSSVGLSFTQPISTISFNIISVLNLLEAIRIVKPDIKFYQASSSEMYGAVKELPVRINAPMHPLSPYAISKSSAYWIVVNYRESYGLFACNGVLFNHESYLRSKNFFIKKVISEAVKNKGDINWFLNVGNIDVRRDFGYSQEYVEAMWLMLQQSKAEDFMICSGTSRSLRSIIEYVFEKVGINKDKIIIDNSLFRPTDIVDIYGDNSEAKEKLKWKCTENFNEILDKLIQEEISNI